MARDLQTSDGQTRRSGSTHRSIPGASVVGEMSGAVSVKAKDHLLASTFELFRERLQTHDARPTSPRLGLARNRNSSL